MKTTLGGQVERVDVCEDGSGSLRFGPRAGLPGNRVLYFDSAPPDVKSLLGKEVEVEDSGEVVLMPCGTKIAEMSGATKLKFTTSRACPDSGGGGK